MIDLRWNNFSLNNDSLGWRVHLETSKAINVGYSKTDFKIAGTPGARPIRGYANEGIFKLVIATPSASLSRLKGLFAKPEGNVFGIGSTKSARNVFVESIEDDRSGSSDRHLVSVSIRIPGVWFRGPLEVSSQTGLSSNSIMSLFPDLDGEITDGELIVGGSGATNVTLTDLGSGTAWRFVGPLSGFYRLNWTTKKLYQVSSLDSWDGGIALAPSAHVTPPVRGFAFELSPSPTNESGNPRNYGRIRFTGGGTISLAVRASGAYTN